MSGDAKVATASANAVQAATDEKISDEKVLVKRERLASGAEFLYSVRDGMMDDRFEQYNADGRLTFRCFYKNGKEHGLSEAWFENGTLSIRANYANGQLNGLYEEWDNVVGQQLQRVHYREGKKHGSYEEWFESGELSIRGNYENGERHGLFESWHDNGQLQLRINYANGKRVGLDEVWYDNGRLESRRIYDSNGGERYEEWYKSGKMFKRGIIEPAGDLLIEHYETWSESGEQSAWGSSYPIYGAHGKRGCENGHEHFYLGRLITEERYNALIHSLGGAIYRALSILPEPALGVLIAQYSNLLPPN